MINHSHQRLAEERIPKLVISYTLTTLTTLVFHSLYTLIDSLFVSWGVGDDAMGGISIVFPFVLLQSAIATALGGGAASIISRKIGAKQLDDAGNIAVNAMLTFWITAILTTLLGFIFMTPLLKGFGVTEELLKHAKDYFTIILIGNLFSTGFSSIIRAEGKMRYALLIWVIPIAVNIILDAVFILLLGWGVKGSAYATIACQFTSFAMSILFFTRFSTLEFKGARLSWSVVKDIFSVGLPALLQSMIPSLSLLLMNNILKSTSGTTAINTFAYVNRILMLALIPFIAVTQAISPIIGYNHGAQDNQRENQTIKFALKISLIYALAALLILLVFPRIFILVFTNDPTIIQLGKQAVQVLALSVPFVPLAMIMGAAYLSQGKKGKAFLMFSIDFIFLAPAAILLSATIGITGVWWGYVLAKILTTLFAAVFLFLNRNKHQTT